MWRIHYQILINLLIRAAVRRKYTDISNICYIFQIYFSDFQMKLLNMYNRRIILHLLVLCKLQHRIISIYANFN